MSKSIENPADPFKKALTEATKVLSDNPEINVTFSVDPPGISGETFRLPQVSRKLDRKEVLLARGTADSLALQNKYHNEKIHSKYLPTGALAKEIYESMEIARCEAIGSKEMPGIATNIDEKIDSEAKKLGLDQVSEQSEAPLSMAVGYLVRHLATGRKMPKVTQKVLEL